MIDPKLLLMLATGTLLLLNGLIARSAAARAERDAASLPAFDGSTTENLGSDDVSRVNPHDAA